MFLFAPLRLDLLQKSHLQSSVDEPGDKFEAEREAFAAVAVRFFDDPPNLEGTDDVLNRDAKAPQGAVVGFVCGAKLAASGFFAAQAGLRVTLSQPLVAAVGDHPNIGMQVRVMVFE